MSAERYTGLADAVHHGCGVATVRGLRLVKVEAVKRRRGRPRKEKAPAASLWVGFCTACGAPRLFHAKPPEQVALPGFTAPAALPAAPAAEP